MRTATVTFPTVVRVIFSRLLTAAYVATIVSRNSLHRTPLVLAAPAPSSHVIISPHFCFPSISLRNRFICPLRTSYDPHPLSVQVSQCVTAAMATSPMGVRRTSHSLQLAAVAVSIAALISLPMSSVSLATRRESARLPNVLPLCSSTTPPLLLFIIFLPSCSRHSLLLMFFNIGAADYADCNGNVTDGCEVDLRADSTCGACNISCLSLSHVTDGFCVSATKQCNFSTCTDRYLLLPSSPPPPPPPASPPLPLSSFFLFPPSPFQNNFTYLTSFPLLFLLLITLILPIYFSHTLIIILLIALYIFNRCFRMEQL